MTRRGVSVAVSFAALLAVAAVWRWSTLHSVDEVGVIIDGGDGGRLPRADPGQEGFDERALQAAAAAVQSQGASALLVMRHGHLLLEQYWRGTDADTLLEGTEFGRAVQLLAAGVAVDRYGMAVPDFRHVDEQRLTAAIATAAGLDYPTFLSRHLWRALDAAPARWLHSGLRARATDWMRVAGVLLHDGRFEGTQVVPAGWVARLLVARAPSGAEPFRAGEVVVLRRAREAAILWLAPKADFSVLCVAAPSSDAAVDETRLPRMIMRALRDAQSANGAQLDELVPGH